MSVEEPDPVDGEAPTPADVLSNADDRPPRLESSRAGAWAQAAWSPARRHPRRAAAAGCLVAAAVGLTWHGATRPPPMKSIGVVDVQPTTSSEHETWLVPHDPDHRISALYIVSTDVPGDAIRVVGIVGPGLSKPTAASNDLPITQGKPGQVLVGAGLDCSKPGWWNVTVGAYSVRVARTDKYDRVVEQDEPIGRTEPALRDEVRQACLTSAVAELSTDSWTVEATPGSPQVRISLQVRNPHPYRLWLQASPGFFREPSVTPLAFLAAPPVTVAAEGTTSLLMASRVLDCYPPPDLPPFVAGNWDAQGTVWLWVRVGLDELADVPPGHNDPQLNRLPITKGLADSVARQVARACQGAPHLTSTVTEAHRLALAGPRLRWRFDVNVRADADRIELGSEGITRGQNPRPPDIYPDRGVTVPHAATTKTGVARFRLVWTLSGCVPHWDGITPEPPTPPTTYATVVVGTRRYNTRLVLADRQVLAAYRGACPDGISAADAIDLGWRAAT